MNKLLLLLFFLCSSSYSFSLDKPGTNSLPTASKINKTDFGVKVVSEAYKARLWSEGTGTVATPAANFLDAPDTPGPITGSSDVCISAIMAYSVVPVQNADSYTWTVPTGWSITSGQGTPTITLLAGNTAGNISVVASNGSGISAARHLAVQASAGSPPAPGNINGPTTLCMGSAPDYSIAPVNGASSYSWSVPAGWTILRGQGTTDIYVMPGIGTGEVSVSAANTCGTSAVKYLAVNTLTPIRNNSINLPTQTICDSNTPENLIGSQALSGNNSYTYQWQSSIEGPYSGFIPAAGVNNTRNYQPAALSQTTWFRRYVVSGCETDYSNTIQVVVAPNLEQNIITSTGPAAICAGSLAAEIEGSVPTTGNDMVNFLWESSTSSAATSFSPVHRQGSHYTRNYHPGVLHQTTWFKRTVIFSCGKIVSSNVLKVEVNNPPPVPVTNLPVPSLGSSFVLYVYDVIPGATYSWTGPNNFTSTEPRPEIKNFNESMIGAYTVTASLNGCQSSYTVNLKGAPLPFVGIDPVNIPKEKLCAGTTLTVPFDTGGVYNPGTVFLVQLVNPYNYNATKVIGSGTTSPILVTIPADLSHSGQYSLRIEPALPAKATVGAAIPIAVIPNLSQSRPATITGNTASCVGALSLDYSITELPGAESYEWTVPEGWTITGGQGTKYLRVTPGAKAGIISVAGINQCGRSQAQALVVNPVTLATPTVTAAARCGSGKVSLTAAGAPAGSFYRWYSAFIGGDVIFNTTGATYITPTLDSTTTYYVAIVSASGCESARIGVTATVNEIPVINPGTNQIVCRNEASFALTSFSPAGGTWTGPGVTVNGLFNPTAAGLGTHILTYTVIQNGCSATATKKITITEAPVVSLAPFINPVCQTNNQYVLTDGLPVGGTYSGRGVSNGIFNATRVGVGTDSIFYTYAQPGGCAVTVARPIRVTADCPAPDDLAANLGLAPNPTSSELYVSLPLPAKTNLILRLLDAKGLVVHEQRYTQVSGEFREKLDVSFNAKGLYTLHLIMDNAMVAKRVVIQ